MLAGGVYSSPAYFSGTVYYGPVGRSLLVFAVRNAKLSSAPTSTTSTSFASPGTSPIVSVSGTSNVILWTYENRNPAVLHAYGATNLNKELYDSDQAANGRDHFGEGNKFIVPTVADGKVFVASTNSIAEFGLLL